MLNAPSYQSDWARQPSLNLFQLWGGTYLSNAINEQQSISAVGELHTVGINIFLISEFILHVFLVKFSVIVCIMEEIANYSAEASQVLGIEIQLLLLGFH